MGFNEEDYQRIIDNNFNTRKNELFFTRDKLYKMAGNSIVVNVLEQIFKQLIYIDKNILREEKVTAIDLLRESMNVAEGIRNKKLKRLTAN